MDPLLVARWLVGPLAVGALALPATAWLLGPLPGRGSGFAPAVGAAVLALTAFWAGQVGFGPATAALGLVVLAAASAAALRAGVTVPRRAAVEAAVVFAAFFLLAVRLRAAAPALDPWAEGYLNFGLVRSLLRAGALPPADVWFAGEAVEYYYGGHLTMAVWALLLDTPARYVPTLALPVVYATLAAGAYELGGAMGARRGYARRVTGTAAALVCALGGNLFEALRLVHAALPAGPAATLRDALGLRASRLAGAFDPFDATHVAHFPTDVPVYAVELGSFHAHVLSQPLTLLAAALALAAVRAERRRGALARLALAGPLAALVLLTNVWSAPTVLGLVALAVAFADRHPATLLPESLRPARTGPRRRELRRYVGGVLVALAVGALALLVAAPFLWRTDATRPLALFPDRTGAGVYAVQWGGLLLAFALALWPPLRGRFGRMPTILGLAAAAALALSLDAAVLAFVVPVLLAAWWATRRADVGGLGVLVLAGAGLLLLVEFVYVRGGVAVGRYNTVYKVVAQVWVLWAVPAGAVLGGALVEGWRRGAGSRGGLRAVAAALLLVTASLYGAFVVGHALDRPAGDLDATSVLEEDLPAYAAAIEWLADRPGQPNVVEAVPTPGLQRTAAASPVSSLTGLPTVAGWDHAADYHSPAAYEDRVRDVRRIYEGPPTARQSLLERYDVGYVVVGPTERYRYEVDRTWGGVVRREFGAVTVYVVLG